MMDITLNGEKKSVEEGATLADLIAALGLEGKRFAVEVNLDIVPRSCLAEHILAEHDRVEIVQAIGGG